MGIQELEIANDLTLCEQPTVRVRRPSTFVQEVTRNTPGLRLRPDPIKERQKVKDECPRLFLIGWKGETYIPQGIRLGKHTIEIIDNSGFVITTEGNEIGVYDRIKSCSGKKENEQQIVAYIFPQSPILELV